MEENKKFNLYTSFNKYKDFSLLRSQENILGFDNDFLLNNRLKESNETLCTNDDNNEPKHPIIDKIQVALDVAGVLGPYGAIFDALNGIIYLCRGDIDSMKFSLIAIFTPIPASVAKGTVNAAKYANKITTKGGYVFWSGGKNARKAAENFAKENGFTTLEMTSIGQKVERKVNNKYLKHIYKQEYDEAIKIAYSKGLKNREDINAYVKFHMNEIQDLIKEAKYGDSNQLYMLLGNKKADKWKGVDKWEAVEEWGKRQFAKASERFAKEAASSGKEIHNFRNRKFNPGSIWIQIERKIIKEYNRSSKVHLVNNDKM